MYTEDQRVKLELMKKVVTSPPQKNRTAMLCGILLALTIATLRFSVVSAGPVTNRTPVGQAPFTKLGIYGSVLGIEQSGRVLEFGNAGRDIAASADIIFRPSSGTVTTQGVRVTANGSSANIYIPGDLCLYNHGTSSFVCAHQISSGASSTLWQQQSVPAYLGGPNYRTLEPQLSANNTPGVRLGSSGAGAITSGTALSVSTTSSSDSNLYVKNLGSDEAARFQGDVYFNDTASVYGQMLINESNVLRDVWHTSGQGVSPNEGKNSGLDADVLNGNQATLEAASSCANTTGTQPRVGCVCFSIRYTTLSLNSTSNSRQTFAPPEKHCIDLANRF